VIEYYYQQICPRYNEQGRWPVKTGFTVTVDMSASDATQIGCRITREGNEYVINGTGTVSGTVKTNSSS
jgi:hypothetical protein